MRPPVTHRLRPEWHEYFLGIAVAVAARTDCRRTRVGAVIVDVDNHIVGTGYPGTAPGRPGCLDGACPRGLADASAGILPLSAYDNCISTHAEANALLHGDRSRFTGAIYVTREPCRWCFTLIRAAGLPTAVYLSGERSRTAPEEWVLESVPAYTMVDMHSWEPVNG